MRQAVDALLSADAQWSALQARVSGLLMAANRRPADDAPAAHELAGVVRELKRSPDVATSPMPFLRARVVA